MDIRGTGMNTLSVVPMRFAGFLLGLALGLCVLVPHRLVAQQATEAEPDIRRRIVMIQRGEGDQVKAELPDLLTRYQNHPGVMFLQGMLTTDGGQASKVYQTVVDNFPDSEWADDALYKLYQYYYSLGLYKTGDAKLAQLKDQYPLSPYASDQAVQAQEANPTPARAEVQEPPPVPGYTIQVGAFSTMKNAEELKTQFERESYTATISTVVTNGKTLHKVWVGEFRTYDSAKRFAGEIKSKYNIDSIVVTR
jgi:hypothetical protein